VINELIIIYNNRRRWRRRKPSSGVRAGQIYTRTDGRTDATAEEEAVRLGNASGAAGGSKLATCATMWPGFYIDCHISSFRQNVVVVGGCDSIHNINLYEYTADNNATCVRAQTTIKCISHCANTVLSSCHTHARILPLSIPPSII